MGCVRGLGGFGPGNKGQGTVQGVGVGRMRHGRRQRDKAALGRPGLG
jgi:hypothetical protein